MCKNKKCVVAEGIYVPLITPFLEGEQQLSLALLKENVKKLNTTAVSGYMPLGSNGESALLSEGEALLVAEAVAEAAAPDKQLFLGVGRESARGTIEFIREIAPLGVDAVFVLTPHFFPKQMTQQALEQYYLQVAEHSPLPVILYNAPGYAGGVFLAPETVAALSKHQNIIGIKDSSKTPAKSFLELLSPDTNFFVLAGTLEKLGDSLLEGAAGGVLSASNYIPALCCRLYTLFKNGQTEKAAALHGQMLALANETTGPFGVPGVKCAMNLRGYSCGVPRLPLQAVEPQKIEMTLTAGITALEQSIERDLPF